MPFRALRELNFGDQVVHAGEMIPEKLAEGVGFVDDPTYSSYELTSGRVAYVPTTKTLPKAKSTKAKAESAGGEPTVIESPDIGTHFEDAPAAEPHPITVPGVDVVTTGEDGETLVQTAPPTETKTRSRKSTGKKSGAKKTAAKKTTAKSPAKKTAAKSTAKAKG